MSGSSEYSSDDITLAGRFSLYIRYHDPFKNYTVVDGNLSSPFKQFPNSTIVNQVVREAEFVMLSDLGHNYYIFYLGVDPMEQMEYEGFNRVYDNGAFCLLKQINMSENDIK